MSAALLTVLVALAGGLGAGARFVADGLIRERRGGGLPVATMAINVTGSLLIGLLTGAVLYHGLAHDTAVLATTGFCGGFTTFSTAMVETVRLVQAGEVRRAVVTLAGTFVLAVLAAGAGLLLMAAVAR